MSTAITLLTTYISAVFFSISANLYFSASIICNTSSKYSKCHSRVIAIGLRFAYISGMLEACSIAVWWKQPINGNFNKRRQIFSSTTHLEIGPSNKLVEVTMLMMNGMRVNQIPLTYAKLAYLCAMPYFSFCCKTAHTHTFFFSPSSLEPSEKKAAFFSVC